MVSHTRIVIIYPALQTEKCYRPLVMRYCFVLSFRETETAYAGSGIFFPLVKLGILKLVNDQPNEPECIDRQLIPFAWSPDMKDHLAMLIYVQQLRPVPD
jgi:hypothetical protein